MIKSLTALSLFALSMVECHSNLHTPAPRGNVKWWGYCSRGWGCTGACDSPKALSPFNSIYNAKKVVKRGETIKVEWLRQNHPGGFVRLAVVPMDASDEVSAFDSSVYKYVCYETNCKEDHHDPMLGHLNGPGFMKCSTDFKIPSNLKDGPITIQWTWFGGGVFYADQEASFANYVSCSDMQLLGGDEYKPYKSDAEFKGGDIANPGGDKCRYWSTNSIHGCPLGAEDNNKQGCGYGKPKLGAPKEWSGNNGQEIPIRVKEPANKPKEDKPKNPLDQLDEIPQNPNPEQNKDKEEKKPDEQVVDKKPLEQPNDNDVQKPSIPEQNKDKEGNKPDEQVVDKKPLEQPNNNVVQQPSTPEQKPSKKCHKKL